MSFPILYPSTETAFDTNGIGILSDALKCNVTEECNGMFEMEMKYPITGLHYADILLRNQIMAKPNPTDQPQPFRAYRITKPLNGMVTVYARHISYDLSGIPAQPFTAPSAALAMQALKDNAVTPCPFEFWTDKDTTATMTNSTPQSIRSLLGGVRGSVLDVYGGEYAFDRYNVRLYAQRGMNRGVSIRYGKNLTSLQQDENCAAVYTGVYPYWTSSEGDLVQLPEKIIDAPGTYDFVRILTLDLSSEWQEQPTEEQLRTRAQRYITENNIGVPKVSLSINFVQLEQYEEYKHLALQERVSLCDTVNVEFPRLGVSATARVYKTVYDVLRDRWESVELGDARTTLADTIATQGQEIKDLPKSSAMQAALAAATATILGARGGAVRFLDTNNDGVPDTIYVADNPDPAQAIKVWRWNYEGWGASENGYDGPFEMAATLEDGFIANFITAGVLSSADKKVKFDLNGAYIDLQGMGSSGGVVRPIHMRLTNGALYAYSSFGGEEKEAIKIVTALDNNGGNIHVFSDGKHAVEIAGKSKGGRIQTGDKNEKVRSGMGIYDSSGTSFIELRGPNGTMIFQAYEGTNGLNGIALYNNAGEIIWQVYENANGTASVYQKTQSTMSLSMKTQSAKTISAAQTNVDKPMTNNIPQEESEWNL